MKTHGKLITAFLIMTLLPILVTSVVSCLLLSYRSILSEKRRDIRINVLTYAYDPEGAVDEITGKDFNKLCRTAERSPERFKEQEYLDSLNSQLKKSFSFILIRKNGTTVYNGGGRRFADIDEHLSSDAYGSSGSDILLIPDGLKVSVRSMEINFSDGTSGYVCLLTDLADISHSVKKNVTVVVIISVCALFIIAFLVLLWIYSGIIKPLNILRIAVRQIEDGNLEKSVKVSGSSEIKDLCMEFEKMRKQLEQTTADRLRYEEDMRLMISNMAHDLRTPLTAIKGYAEGIIDGVADSPARRDKYLRTIYSKANDLSYLVDELSQFAKVEQEKTTYNFKTINLNDYFSDCVDELSLDMESKGFTIKYRNNVPNTVHVLADPEQLKRVINNITGNSVKYCDTRPGIITITVTELVKENELYKKVSKKNTSDENISRVLVSIKDNGKGVSHDDLSKIFKRFYRADASRNSSKPGSGLGLAIVAKIIADHGGQIWAESGNGSGLNIFFTLVEK